MLEKLLKSVGTAMQSVFLLKLYAGGAGRKNRKLFWKLTIKRKSLKSAIGRKNEKNRKVSYN